MLGVMLERLGAMTVHSLRAVFRIIGFFAVGLWKMIRYGFGQLGRLFRWWAGNIRYAFAEHNRPAREALDEVRRANGARETGRHVLHLAGTYLFGEHGLLRTGFNYILPVVTVAFLVALLHYCAGLRYAVCVTVGGEELGLLEERDDFEDAEEEVRQRVALAGEAFDTDFHPVYTLRIVTDGDRFLSVPAIADRLLAGAGTELADAFGVYVDGKFAGAVKDTEPIAAGMAAALNDYAAGLDDLVDEVYYEKEITFQEGTFLAESLSDPETLVKRFTEEKREERRYTVAESDTVPLIAAKFHMTVEELEKLNPEAVKDLKPGTGLRVQTVTREIPIVYTRNLTLTSYIDYPTVRVETASLNLGVEKVLSKGAIGERSSEVKITYEDGAERSREVLSTTVTRNPVPEQLGVGTYSAQPDSTSTVLTGTGQFGWPVRGGYISDTFISNRNHKGMDIAAPMGTEIYAAQAGTVYTAGWNSGGYGNYVIIDHADGYQTYYAHCSRVVCFAGQEVEKGQLIAYVGSTGDSTGPHCHFEVRSDNIPVNPASYLRVNAG